MSRFDKKVLYLVFVNTWQSWISCYGDGIPAEINSHCHQKANWSKTAPLLQESPAL